MYNEHYSNMIGISPQTQMVNARLWLRGIMIQCLEEPCSLPPVMYIVYDRDFANKQTVNDNDRCDKVLGYTDNLQI